MAQAELYSDRLKQLSDRAAASRQAFTEAGRSLQSSADLGQRLQNSFQKNITAWLGSAAVVGWVLSKLPARKKKIYAGKGSHTASATTEAVKGGVFISILGIVFKLVQPLLQKLLVQQLGTLTEKHLANRRKP